MSAEAVRFERFVLDVADRRLTCDGAPVELNSRYLDALALLVREQGRLVTKQRLLDEAWKGVPVTDEALTQCIRTLRRRLGDDAARPRFIATEPKHGYRFIAPVEPLDTPPALAAETEEAAASPLRLTLLGAAGGGAAGAVGGAIYGLVAASQPGAPALSMVLVAICVTALVAAVGAAGVCGGLALAKASRRRLDAWTVVGGALGGGLVGGVAKLLGVDALNLLFGRAPEGLTGALEGLVLGGATALGLWLALRRPMRPAAALTVAGVVAAMGGLAVPLLGGRLMAGSLDRLTAAFPGSHLSLAPLGRALGEAGLGPVAHALSGGLEGFLFGVGIAGAWLWRGAGLNAR